MEGGAPGAIEKAGRHGLIWAQLTGPDLEEDGTPQERRGERDREREEQRGEYEGEERQRVKSRNGFQELEGSIGLVFL